VGNDDDSTYSCAAPRSCLLAYTVDGDDVDVSAGIGILAPLLDDCARVFLFLL
jgi:hypothetical protein